MKKNKRMRFNLKITINEKQLKIIILKYFLDTFKKLCLKAGNGIVLIIKKDKKIINEKILIIPIFPKTKFFNKFINEIISTLIKTF